jgi:hypothetical protein
MTERISNNLCNVYLDPSTAESTPTEQEIRDCFDPLYNTAGAADTPSAAGSGSTGETDDEGESSADDGTSDDEGESEN